MNKILHVPAAILFLIMAAIQINDPDPFYWIGVYMATSLNAVAMLLGIKRTTFINITIGMVLAGLLFCAAGTIDYFKIGDFAAIYGNMNDEKPYLESAREFGGLVIAVIYLAIIRVLHTGSQKAPD